MRRYPNLQITVYFIAPFPVSGAIIFIFISNNKRYSRKRLRNTGYPIIIVLVFHRILDFKTGLNFYSGPFFILNPLINPIVIFQN
jgi:hypothetical protein